MAATLTFHADAYCPGTRHPLHQHDELHLSLVLSGRVAETVGRVTEWAGALSVVAKDAGVPHATDFGPAGGHGPPMTPTCSTSWPRGTVSSVAHSRGFADEPHLCREFRRAANITPARYRALVENLDYT